MNKAIESESWNKKRQRRKYKGFILSFCLEFLNFAIWRHYD